MIGYAKKIEKIIRKSAFDKTKKKPELEFNHGLALTGVRTTGPWSSPINPFPRYQSPVVKINPQSPCIHLQILQTDLRIS